jgi:AP-2 complex subunit alpha
VSKPSPATAQEVDDLLGLSTPDEPAQSQDQGGGSVGGGGGESAAAAAAAAPAAPAAAAAAAAPVAPTASPSDADLLGDLAAVSVTAAAASSPGPVQLKQWFGKLCVSAAGVLYEDASVQIGVKSEYTGPRGRLSLFFGNKSGAELTAVSTAIAPSTEVKVSGSALAPTLAARAQSQQVLEVECAAPFAAAPPIRVLFTPAGGEPRAVTLKLPLVVAKFTAPLDIPGEFMDQWRAIAAGPPREVQAVFKSADPVDVVQICAQLAGLNLKPLDGVDPNKENIVAAGTFTAVPASGQVSVAVLARLETNKAQNMVRLTVKSKSGALSAAFHALITSVIGA